MSARPGTRPKAPPERPRPRLLPLALAALAALAGAAQAARGELLLEVFLGKAFNRPADLVLSQPGKGTDARFRGVAFEDQSFRSPPYYGYRAVYFPSRRSPLGVGLEFVHAKAVAVTDRSYPAEGRLRGRPAGARERLADTVQSFEVSHGLNLLTLNLVARPAAPGRAWPYGGLGVGVGIPHAESVVEGKGGPSRYELSGQPVLQLSVGARGFPAGAVGAFGEYKLSYGRLEAEVAEGTARTAFTTQHAILGAGYRP